MRDKLPTVLILIVSAVFVVGGLVYSAGGSISIPNGATGVGVDGKAITNIDTLAYKIYSSTQECELGTAGATSRGLATGDVFVGGKLEVDGVLYMDGSGQNSGTFAQLDNGIMRFGSGATDSFMLYSASHTPDSVVLTPGDDSKALLFMDNDRYATDMGFPLQANPTFVGYSATATTTMWWSLTHDQNNMVVKTGLGHIDLQPATGGLRIARKIAASVAAPATCDVNAEGTLVYVNDNDDGAASQLCICATITDDATYDWVRVADHTTACSFF